MSTAIPGNWEQSLLSLAGEAHQPAVPSGAIFHIDKKLIGRAYDYCASLTARHSRSFYLATALLPGDKRRAMRALYAFCRVSDDIVDRAGPDARFRLGQWRAKALSARPALDDPVCLAWSHARSRYRVPQRYAEQLLDGVGRDLDRIRYETFEELAAYAYGVASTVGLMSQHIIGFSSPEATRYAIKLGVALQITNILRDVGEDWRAGRLYLPTHELAAYNLAETDIAAGAIDDRWRSFLAFQIRRNRRLYDEAWPGIALLQNDGRLAVAAAADFYRAILKGIEANDYDVFSRRAYVGSRVKLSMLPGIWWRTGRPAAYWEPSGDINAPRFANTGIHHPDFFLEG
jgi:phytoene synthase